MIFKITIHNTGTTDLPGMCGTINVTGMSGTTDVPGMCGTTDVPGMCRITDVPGICGTTDVPGMFSGEGMENLMMNQIKHFDISVRRSCNNKAV